jgi:L-fuculose-phosphate aldolase
MKLIGGGKNMWREISRFGQKLVHSGLTHAHFGNISVRAGDGFIITTSGSMLDEIDENFLVQLDQCAGDVCPDKKASSETIVHRLIYQQTPARAIMHAHSPYAVALSLLSKEDYLEPRGMESKSFLQRIPLVTGESGSEELAVNLAAALGVYPAAIARGHGTFAVGNALSEAYVGICSVEHACQVHYLCSAGVY